MHALEHPYFFQRISFLGFLNEKVRQISHFLWCCTLVNICIRKYDGIILL